MNDWTSYRKKNMAYDDEYDIRESFSWITPEFKISHSGKDTIKIKGVALRGDTVSLNNRKYVDEELKKSARTFIGKPMTVNHDMTKKIGHIDWAEYEDGCLEYLATIKKQPYVNLIRDHSTTIKGVSIEAMYLKNACASCGKPFDTEEQFSAHMRQKHFVTVDPTRQVHGMLGQALSLVLSPEVCGVPDTTLEVTETNRLFEMIIKEKGGKTEKMNEQEEPKKDEPEEEDEDEKEEDKLEEQEKPKKEPKSCPLGQAYNPQSEQCEDIQEILSRIDEIFKASTKEQMKAVYESILTVADHVVDETKNKMKGEQGILRAVELLADLTNHVQKMCNITLENKPKYSGQSPYLQEQLQNERKRVNIELNHLATEIAKTNRRASIKEKYPLKETETQTKSSTEINGLKLEVVSLKESLSSLMKGRFKGISPQQATIHERVSSVNDPLKRGK